MRSLFVFACVIVWLSSAVGGVLYLAQYKNTASDEGGVYPLELPSSSRLRSEDGMPTLIFFAHPKCPCTRAAIRELSRLLTDINGKVTAYVVITKPSGVEDGWTDTGLRSSAEAMPNVRVVIDDDEYETKLFNARTSSLTLLYDSNGSLRFNGGVTSARGHEGNSAGRTAIFDIITAESVTRDSPVFGCPLQSPDCDGTAPKQ